MIRVQEWECEECGYIVSGPRPPIRCPECSAPRDSFEPLDDDDKYESESEFDDEDLDEEEFDLDDLEWDEDWDDEEDE
jgi:rubredoxin